MATRRRETARPIFYILKKFIKKINVEIYFNRYIYIQ